MDGWLSESRLECWLLVQNYLLIYTHTRIPSLALSHHGPVISGTLPNKIIFCLGIGSLHLVSIERLSELLKSKVLCFVLGDLIPCQEKTIS